MTSKRTILFINTAEPTSVVAIVSDSTIVAQQTWVSEQNLGNDLLPKIDTLLHEAAISLTDLTHVVVFPGPGSFTGTRIGVTTANMLAWANNIPVLAAVSADPTAVLSLDLPEKEFVKSVMPYYDRPASTTVKKSV